MSQGFKSEPIIIYKEEVENIIRKYKKIKKYMKSTYYDLLNMEGTEKIVNNILKEDFPEE
jgi:DNA integrity scanning protein DisA with diadenylate cyclase activity